MLTPVLISFALLAVIIFCQLFSDRQSVFNNAHEERNALSFLQPLSDGNVRTFFDERRKWFHYWPAAPHSGFRREIGRTFLMVDILW